MAMSNFTADNIELKDININSLDINDLFTDVKPHFRNKLITTFNIIKANQHLIPIVKVNVYNQELVILMQEAHLNLSEDGTRLTADFYIPLCFRCACVLNGCYESVFPQQKS